MGQGGPGTKALPNSTGSGNSGKYVHSVLFVRSSAFSASVFDFALVLFTSFYIGTFLNFELCISFMIVFVEVQTVLSIANVD